MAHSRRTLDDEAIVKLLLEDSEDDSEEDGVENVYGSGSSLQDDCANVAGEHAGSDGSDAGDGLGVQNVDTDSDEGQTAPQRHRKVLTPKRLVNCLDKSLDETCYKKLNAPTDVEDHECIMTKATKKVPAKVLSWTNQRPGAAGRQGAENILRTRGSTIDRAKDADTPIKAWQVFMTDAMVDLILENTNRKIESKLARMNLTEIDRKNRCHLKTTTKEEMLAFIGILYVRGLLGLNHHNYKLLFEGSIGHPVFGATMSCNRFFFLHSNITFDDIADRGERFIHDRFAAARDLFEMLNDNCSRALQPDEFLAIDETLYGTRNQISFKQYNSSKPEKYGLLFKSVNAVRYPFTFRAVVYAGKPTGEPGPHYVQGIMPVVKSLVTQLSTFVDLQGRNITMDRLYTSIELFE